MDNSRRSRMVSSSSNRVEYQRQQHQLRGRSPSSRPLRTSDAAFTSPTHAAATSTFSENHLGNSDKLERQNVHVRQNFGCKERTGGYVPPQTDFTPTRDRSSFETSLPQTPVPVSPDDDQSTESEMPFDMMNDTKKRNRAMGGDNRIPPEPQTPNEEYPSQQRYNQQTSFESIWDQKTPDRNSHTISTHSFQNHHHHHQQQQQQQQQYHHQQHNGKFVMKAPRISSPTLMKGHHENETNQNRRVGPHPQHPSVRELESTNSYSHSKDPIGDATSFSQVTSNDTEHSDRSYKFIAEVGVPRTRTTSKDMNGHPNHHMEGEDDSIFDFEEEVKPHFPEKGRKPVKVTHIVHRRSPTYSIQDNEQDDTSLDTYGRNQPSPTNLQERAQQAWKSRQKKISSLKSKRDPASPRGNNTVSFGEQDTVQYFEPHQDETTAQTAVSVDDRSLNSEYTKTLESEVEDMIKDILFIGNGATSRPGRRKFKHKHEIKQKLRKRQTDTQGSLETTPSLEEKDSIPLSKPSDETPLSKEPETERTMEGSETRDADQTETPTTKDQTNNNTSTPNKDSIWEYVEVGISALSTALGLPAPVPGTNEKSFPRGDCRPSNNILSFETCAGRLSPEPAPLSSQPGFSKLIDYAQDLVYGPMGEQNTNEEISEELRESFTPEPLSRSMDSENVSMSISKESIDDNDDDEQMEVQARQLETDPRLVHLARHAAKSLHRTQGVEFDDSYEICMLTDITTSVVQLSLPMGLIFLENNGGCFVTKVSPDGSAARSGGVEVGDQLAAINGAISVKITVDEICRKIKHSRNPRSVELVFLRYIGPFRPCRKPVLEGQSFDWEPTGSPYGSFDMPAPTPQKVQTTPDPVTTGKKKGFRLFGRGKKVAQKK